MPTQPRPQLQLVLVLVNNDQSTTATGTGTKWPTCQMPHLLSRPAPAWLCLRGSWSLALLWVKPKPTPRPYPCPTAWVVVAVWGAAPFASARRRPEPSATHWTGAPPPVRGVAGDERPRLGDRDLWAHLSVLLYVFHHWMSIRSSSSELRRRCLRQTVTA